MQRLPTAAMLCSCKARQISGIVIELLCDTDSDSQTLNALNIQAKTHTGSLLNYSTCLLDHLRSAYVTAYHCIQVDQSCSSDMGAVSQVQKPSLMHLIKSYYHMHGGPALIPVVQVIEVRIGRTKDLTVMTTSFGMLPTIHCFSLAWSDTSQGSYTEEPAQSLHVTAQKVCARSVTGL